ncbi:hypothetical protein TWF694_003993 [Orbilia ellipsospora]|uniref:Early meiotic induction protein 1 n=1 Tax=Orbilia ellipsospora TaxID=2528407 RepID=A0AAV9WWR0_9PEZI
MGIWGRKPTAAADSSNPFGAPSQTQSKDDSSTTPAPSTTPSPISLPKSRDDVAEEELSALLKSFNSEDPSSQSSKPSSTTSFQDTLYPSTMSCREAFDELYFCYSLGGQFKNLYRYGTYRECTDKSADFWFCMRTKMYGPNTKKEMIVKYHREKEAARYKKGPSSEDVWSVRTEPLQGQFMGDFKNKDPNYKRLDHERDI